MDYEKLYKEALERARKCMKDGGISQNTIDYLCNIFPELKEDKDERIRRELIRLVYLSYNDLFPYTPTKEEYEEMTAWLKKQEFIDRDKLTKGVLIDVANSIIQLLDANVAEGNMCLSNMECLDIENCVINADWDKVYCYMKKKLEKQGEQKAADNKEKLDVLNFIRKETCCGLAEANNALLKLIKVLKEHPFPIMDKSYKLKIEWEEQQGEQNLANNVKPKFNGGDWIVWKDKCYKVNYNGCGYELVDQNGLSTSLEYGTIDKNAHLWTLADAKDGDVLVSQYNNPFIYNGNRDFFHIGSYCGISAEDKFKVAIEKCHWTENVNIYPSTKEQRDLLFSKMKEAGYVWDSEKKELKKPVIRAKFKVGDWICNGGGNPCKVDDVFGNYYELCSIEDYKYNKPISDVDANYHLWTIDDAKDHDILTVDGRPFIYCCNNNYKGNYCCIDSDGKFRPNLDFGFNGKTILPATKEQRDLILQMSENTPLNY